MVYKMKQDVLNINNIKVGDIELPSSIFGLPPRIDILSRVVEWQLSKSRTGNHKTKQVAEVSGTTKKMSPQKGTGNARHGSKRAPQFRGGGITFGPVVRSHEYSLPKKIRKLGLKTALSSKFHAGDVIIVDNFEINEPKTKILKNILSTFNINNCLLIDTTTDKLLNTILAANNIINFDILPQIGANVLDIMRKEKIILTTEAIRELEVRLK
jgi:large subunit ribosomal protein L4